MMEDVLKFEESLDESFRQAMESWMSQEDAEIRSRLLKDLIDDLLFLVGDSSLQPIGSLGFMPCR